MVKSKAKLAAHKPSRKPGKDSTHNKKARPAANKKAGSHAVIAGAPHGKGHDGASNGHAAPSALQPNDPQLAQAQQSIGSFKSASGVELAEKVKELLRLAQ